MKQIVRLLLGTLVFFQLQSKIIAVYEAPFSEECQSEWLNAVGPEEFPPVPAPDNTNSGDAGNSQSKELNCGEDPSSTKSEIHQRSSFDDELLDNEVAYVNSEWEKSDYLGEEEVVNNGSVDSEITEYSEQEKETLEFWKRMFVEQ